MIEEKTLSFGPKRKGPNILINKYLRKDESFFQKIYKEAEKVLGVVEGSMTDIKDLDGNLKIERRAKEDEERFSQV